MSQASLVEMANKPVASKWEDAPLAGLRISIAPKKHPPIQYVVWIVRFGYAARKQFVDEDQMRALVDELARNGPDVILARESQAMELRRQEWDR